MMKSFRENLYKSLIKREGFYMKQYYSRYHDKEIYVPIKEVSGGLYCLLVTDEKDEEVDLMEAIEYIKTLGQRFNINLVIMSDNEYINVNHREGVNKIIVNKHSGAVISFDEPCRPIAFIINSMHVDKVEKEGGIFKSQPVTMTLIAINIVVFIITAMVSGNILDIDTIVLVKFGAKFNALIKQGEVWRLITCAFLHGGIMHIACNMYSLYIIGPQIEYIYGTTKYIIIYLISCFTSSLLSYIASPSISVGASGGIFGLMGALLAFAILERHRLEKKYISSLIQVILVNLFIGLSLSNIDNFGHLGGIAGGFTLGLAMYKMRKRKIA